MDSDWTDGILNNDALLGEDSSEGFYCPYTNGPDCPLFTRGWQPQELCVALDCEQYKLFQKREQKRTEAA